MKFLRLYSTSPYYNLAVEEYFLSASQEDIFIIWQNEPTVVIGKNQNVYCEIDFDYLKKNKINVARRITGGGAVYHDLGNVNYSYIAHSRSNGLDFAYFSAPIIKALNSLGLSARLSGRNDILIGDKKISGNAQCNRAGRVLHHGTLLFDSDLLVLSRVLSVDTEKLRSKALKSTRSRVTNIREELSLEMSAAQFIDYISRYIIEEFSAEVISAPVSELIDELTERNSSEQWLYPDRDMLSRYDMTLKKRFDIGTLCLDLKLKNEKIISCKLSGDFFGAEDLSLLEGSFEGLDITEMRSGNFEIFGIDLIMGLNKEMLYELARSIK